MTFGIDISVYQRGMSLAQAKQEGVQFAIIKFGGAECGLFKDSQAENFYNQAAECGMPVGAYFFAKCTTAEDAYKEANYFLSIIKGKSFPCKVWYDIEGSMGSLSKETLNSIAKAFCQTVKNGGFDCGVYANASTFNKIDNDGSFSALFPKWVAYWGKSKPSSVREGVDAWQFGGETNLIRSNKICGRVCDQDYIYFEIGEVTPIVPETVEVPNPVLKKGDKGAEVKKLQKALIAAGCSLPKYGADGDYGNETASAVSSFQKRAFETGIYDENTYNALKSYLKI